jgi:hypothetical protein
MMNYCKSKGRNEVTCEVILRANKPPHISLDTAKPTGMYHC